MKQQQQTRYKRNVAGVKPGLQESRWRADYFPSSLWLHPQITALSPVPAIVWYSTQRLTNLALIQYSYCMSSEVPRSSRPRLVYKPAMMMFSTCPSVRLLPNVWTRYFENECTVVDGRTCTCGKAWHNQLWGQEVKDQGFLLHLSLFGVAHAPFVCQRWGLPHRLAQCVTPGKGLV